MKIIVLAGGTSTEREISIVSGSGVCRALRARGHRAALLDVFFGCGEEEARRAFDQEYDVDRAEAVMKEKKRGTCRNSENPQRIFRPLGTAALSGGGCGLPGPSRGQWGGRKGAGGV